ncbi:MAG TPA: Type 1 glutamine amidotransferase-like domain-containing protein [Candidatus Saccharimonadales bacterium]|nr:Type 1 glutamine amidotransferase-like domain-containing protein [Candidatus Saccharimonadales bacterium]
MRLYLSSFRNGNKPDELLRLLGVGRNTAVINNAQDFISTGERDDSLVDEMNRLKDIGLEPAEVDLRKYFNKPEGLKERLASFDLIWVRGGNCFVLRRAFRQSGADAIISELLAEDKIVYGGYSAGIDMLVPSLHGAELVDEPHIVPDGYEPPVIWECLGLLPYAVAPHYKSDHPESAAIDRSVEYLINNHIPFIALRDGEAIVMNGDQQRIVG